mmetsp:Transcript_289/g.683  ORF Transcript_289/g.683 Transcript_289/m.683 type:complete len:89 (-) Transcript_289:840-1106(-)
MTAPQTADISPFPYTATSLAGTIIFDANPLCESVQISHLVLAKQVETAPSKQYPDAIAQRSQIMILVSAVISISSDRTDMPPQQPTQH